MTDTVTTPRDFRSPANGRGPEVDSPGASARARAIIPATQSDGNSNPRTDPQKSWLSRQDFWTARPASLEQAWNASRVDARRIPNQSAALRRGWKALNGTERLVFFVLLLAAPAVLQGPLRHFFQRPTRRLAFYLILAALTVALIIGAY